MRASTMPKSESTTISKYLDQLAGNISAEHGQEYIYRGQSNKKWKLKSGAERRLKNPQDRERIIDYLSETLITPCKRAGYHYGNGRELQDLEILAKLQHFGAATCLLDFTHQFLIALWFASQDTKTDGKVYGFNRSDIKKVTIITEDHIKKTIREILSPVQTDQGIERSENPKVFYWQSPATENRMISQSSCFLFSSDPIVKDFKIIVSKEDKPSILQELKEISNYTEITIYNDFYGFASSHAENKPLLEKTEQDYLDEAIEYAQSEKYQKAIASCDHALHKKRDNGRTFSIRGYAKFQLKRHEESVEDFNEAIRIGPQNAFQYAFRGESKRQLERYKEAIEDFGEAIKIDSQNALPYIFRGKAKHQLERYEAAIEDFDEAIRRNSRDDFTHVCKGQAHIALKQYKEAIEDFTKALEIDPKSEFAQQGLQEAQEMLNKE